MEACSFAKRSFSVSGAACVSDLMNADLGLNTPNKSVVDPRSNWLGQFLRVLNPLNAV